MGSRDDPSRKASLRSGGEDAWESFDRVFGASAGTPDSAPAQVSSAPVNSEQAPVTPTVDSTVSPVEGSSVTEKQGMWANFDAAFSDSRAESTPASGNDPAAPARAISRPLPQDLPTRTRHEPQTNVTEPAQVAPAHDVREMVPREMTLPRVQVAHPSPELAIPRSVRPTTGSISIEYRVSTTLKVNHRAILSLRLRFSGAHRNCRVVVKSDLLSGPAEREVDCPTSGDYELGQFALTPVQPGDHGIGIEIVMFDADGIPDERQTGDFVVTVVEDKGPDVIHAGGDVIIVGGKPNIAPPLPGTPDLPPRWTPCALLADLRFARRVANLLPPRDANRPSDISQLEGRSCLGAVYAGLSSNRYICYAICFDQEGSLGRGGVDDATWWLQPYPDDEARRSRLSRRHATIAFRGRHAWVIDLSANGTSLNGRRLTRNEPTVLASGDRIDLAEAMAFIVDLTSSGEMVTGVTLKPADNAHPRCIPILARPGSWAPLGIEGKTAWLRGEGQAQVVSASTRRTIRTSEEVTIEGDVKLAWYEMDGVLDQEQLV